MTEDHYLNVGPTLTVKKKKPYDPKCVVENPDNIRGNAKMSGRSMLIDRAVVADRARLKQHARAGGGCIVMDDAIVTDYGSVRGDCMILNNAKVQYHGVVEGNVIICGDTVIGGQARVGNTGYHIYGGTWTKTPLAVCSSLGTVVNCAPGEMEITTETTTHRATIEQFDSNREEIFDIFRMTGKERKEHGAIIDLFVKIAK